ncbi:MAG: aryl-sulfate sulfotransferase [Candidatus Thermoplasmatota archaeon]|nr:aryl-sulfate sulfotransferase [Candidatus Thermoplasmatota archaeon]
MNMRWLWTLVCTCMLFLSAVPVAQATTDDGEPWPTPTCSADRQNWTMGLIYCNEEASLGYTLFSPIPSNTTYLIDHEGRELHRWSSPGEHRPALSAYLLPDGDLLRTANIAQTAVGNFSGGGTGGKVERIAWDGTLEWSWEYSSTLHISHHDIEPMPNGNLLMIAWEERTEEEALQAGRNPAIASDSPGGENNVWPDHIIEVKPVGSNDAEIVWRWYAWDHLIQDFDETKDNYGVVADHPELLNINYVGATGNQAGRADWMHCNGLDYNSALDQIALSCRGMNEVYIIDHSTTTEEAAGHTGGNAGKGGDILYRWGNPQVYHKGLSSDQQFFAQHDVQWIEAGHPDEGGLIVFNNGVGRYPAYSSVDIIHPPTDNGTYVLEANGTFGPNLPSWTWDQGEAMYSGAISGAQALANGNILVTHGTQGTLYEVNRDGEIVWEYIGPVGPDGSYVQGEPLPEGNRAGTTANAIFKATHYPVDHPAFTNRTMLGMDYIEHWNDSCPEEEAWGWDKNGDGCVDDSDNDGITDPYDRCDLGDDTVDEDNDGIIDACDALVDSDGDGVANSVDLCEGHDDAVDDDNDGLPEPCDTLVDSDNDTVPDSDDLCEGHDDLVDADSDSLPDGCDPLLDTDGDGVADSEDICPAGDDNADADMDGLPDACDDTPQPAENTTIVEEDQTRQPLDSSDQTDNRASLLTRYPIEVLLVGGMVLVGLLRAYTRSSKR